jgi:hypothetical protein
MFKIIYRFGNNEFTSEYYSDVYIEAIKTYYNMIRLPKIYDIISINFDLPED